MEHNEQFFNSTEHNDFNNDIKKSSMEHLNTLKNPIEPGILKKIDTPLHRRSKMDIVELEMLLNNLRRIGFDKHINEWVELKENNPVFSNSGAVSKEQLNLDKLKLHDIIIEINDKLFSVLNDILCKFPGYCRLKNFNQRVNTKIRRINRKLLSFDEIKCENTVTNQYSVKSFKCPDDVCSDSSKQPLRVTFLDNAEYNDKNQSFDYDVNSMVQKIHFAENDDLNDLCNNDSNKINLLSMPQYLSTSTENFIITQSQEKTKFQRNKSILKKSKNVMKTTYRDTNPWISEINSQIRALPTSTVSSLPFVKNKTNINKCNGLNNSVKYNTRTSKNSEDIINVNREQFYISSIIWNDSEENINNEILGNNNNEILENLSEDLNLKKCKNMIDADAVKYKYNDNASKVKLIGNIQNDSIGRKFNNLDFPHCREMLNIFRMKFGLHQFRPNQLSAINAAILGYDCFILMPTGGGKSLCYQLPALISLGITIVISPLRSLIIDQIQKLSSLDIPAMYLTADLSDEQIYRVFRKLHETSPDLKLLYVTPEKLSMSTKFCRSLDALYQRRKLARFVIDEVHCVSQWGHDFRPDYKKLCVLKENFPDVPIIVLTATATRRVRSDILHQLHLHSPMWFISSFNRPNLRYSVIPKKTRAACQQIVDIIKSKFSKECGIVYCITRKDCDDHAKALFMKGIEALSYHAGLDDKVRIERQSQWISEKVKVICATIAFGMGIDKPNVRFVIHSSIPKSIEGYYQESGRAGRDGDAADCLLLYNYADMHRYRNIMERNDYANVEALKTHLDNLYKIVHFCENLTDCRRALQLNYFGEKFDRQECIVNSETTCDNCRTYDKFQNMDVTDDAKALVKLIQSLNNVRKNNVTILQVVDIYKGSNISSISYKLGYNYHEWFGRGKSMTKCEIERLLHNLVIEGYLCENMELNNGMICAYVAPGQLANELLYHSNVQIFIQKKRMPENITTEGSRVQISAVANAELKELEQRCYGELFDMVNGIAGALDVSANSIMNIVALRAMSQQLPCDEQAMLKIPHVTKANFLKYGKALLDVTQKYSKEKQDYLDIEERNQPEFLDYEYYNSESECDWTENRNISSNNANKRKRNKSNVELKKFKYNDQYYDYDEDVMCQKTDKNNNTRGNKAYKNTNRNKFFNTTRAAKLYNITRGRRPGSGRGRGAYPKYNNNDPGLCEFTKKHPMINSQ